MSIEQKRFGTMPDGTNVDLFTLTNLRGMRLEVITLGCRIVKLFAPDRNGKLGDVVLGHDTLEEYLRPDGYLGAAIGRFGNRIGDAKFTLNGQEYNLPQNDHGHCLHGGDKGYDLCVWRMKRCNNNTDAPSITFEHHDPDGANGFPGNLDVTVTYTLTTDDALVIDYTAKTDAETPINLTNHSYFNLTGDHSKTILNHEVQITAEYYTEAGENLIPTGRLIPVKGTPMDFNKPKTIGADIKGDEAVLKSANGYDHNFALSGKLGMRKVGEVYEQTSGRVMMVFTDMPGMQLYTGNSFPDDNNIGKNGVEHKSHCAFCLETQFFPDSVNHPEFPFRCLKPEEAFHTTTTYKFERR